MRGAVAPGEGDASASLDVLAKPRKKYLLDLAYAVSDSVVCTLSSFEDLAHSCPTVQTRPLYN